MRKYVLMSSEEPTDLELETLMSEVAKEVKRKALLAKKNLDDTIANEIKIIQE